MRSLLTASALAVGLLLTSISAQAAEVRMFVRHEVTDYATWRKVYNTVGPRQQKAGVVSQAVYRSTDDPNDVTVVLDFRSAEKAKAFGGSDQLKKDMQGAGVKGAPTIWYAQSTAGASGKPGHVRMFVHHEVSDYASWRKGYDAFQASAKKMGSTARAVYQGTDDPNDVTAYHDFASAAKAKAFAGSGELKSAMQAAGVKGQPQIWFTMRAAK
jgi:hypothetical protein